MDNKERFTHPAYGQIRFSRITSNAKDCFYGSDLSVENYIELTICHSEVERDGSRDWHYDKGIITKLKITPNQFSELITSMNMGSGVPCTLLVYDGKRIEPLVNEESRKDFSNRIFKERMVSFAKTLSEKRSIAEKIIQKKALSKDDQHALSWTMGWIIQEVKDNIPFFAECFQEQMDKVVLEAKSEVEAAILHKITTLGLEALKNEIKLIDS